MRVIGTYYVYRITDYFYEFYPTAFGGCLQCGLQLGKICPETTRTTDVLVGTSIGKKYFIIVIQRIRIIIYKNIMGIILKGLQRNSDGIC